MTAPVTKATLEPDLEVFNSAGDIEWVFLSLDGSPAPAITQAEFDQLMVYLLENRQIEFLSGFVPDETTNISVGYRGPVVPVGDANTRFDFGLGDWRSIPFYVSSGFNVGILIT